MICLLFILYPSSKWFPYFSSCIHRQNDLLTFHPVSIVKMICLLFIRSIRIVSLRQLTPYSPYISMVNLVYYPTEIARFTGVNMEPTWVPSAPAGPHVGPINLAIRDVVDLTHHITNVPECKKNNSLRNRHRTLNKFHESWTLCQDDTDKINAYYFVSNNTNHWCW